jgi:hypothetical protein
MTIYHMYVLTVKIIYVITYNYGISILIEYWIFKLVSVHVSSEVTLVWLVNITPLTDIYNDSVVPNR